MAWFASVPTLGARGIESASEKADQPGFTHLQRLAAPKTIGSAAPYPGGSYLPAHLVDGWGHTAYASHGKGTDTFVDFDFQKPVDIVAFQHQDRTDPATVDQAELIFSNQADFSNVLARQPIDHVGRPGGMTMVVFAKPITSRYVRWKVTKLTDPRYTCVGGSDVGFFTTDGRQTLPRKDTLTTRARQAVLHNPTGPVQPITLTLLHPYAEPADVMVEIEGLKPIPLQLRFGRRTLDVTLPAVETPRTVPVVVRLHGKPILQQQLKRTPVRNWQLYFLPHSHVDIGYTHVQTEVQQRQWDHFRKAIEIINATAAYPPEAQFRWNTEGLWAVDSYLKQADAKQKKQFLDAVRGERIHLDGLYGNELTALCRPEELLQLTACARKLSKEYGIPIDSAMISDVPGYTWGTVPALTQSGIKYLSIGPNHTHRIGFTLKEWGDRPFWWESPSGKSRLLCWMAGKAYSWFHGSRIGTLSATSKPAPFLDYLDELVDKDYTYDMVQIRYSIGGDNGPPDKGISDFVKAWNERYIWPRMRISTTHRMMQALEQRYGEDLPRVRGDFTPYWEDGAASSARETSKNRMASERLVQAEALWATLAPASYPADDFDVAWRNAVLYDEHTWGAHCSISQPESPFTKSQWKIKQAFALDADRQSRDLLQRAVKQKQSEDKKVDALDILNTGSWQRTDLVVLDADLPLVGHVVKDPEGRLVPSQVTRRGNLMFVASEVPPFGAKRYLIEPGEPKPVNGAYAKGHVVGNESIRVELDPETGAISSLRWGPSSIDLVDRQQGNGLNQYIYVKGRDPAQRLSSHVVKIEACAGGLTSSLVAILKSPGCKVHVTIVRVIRGIDRIDIINVLGKMPILTKEAVHLTFPFRVPDGVMRMDIPWAVIRPESDQLAGSCKNYFTVGRWVDISNQQTGVTWATLDAPLVEVGKIRMDVPSPHGTDGWVRKLEPTQTFFSYVMNNYWETNYKASQFGRNVFRYSLMPHGGYDQVAAMRFAIERSQPLVCRPVDRRAPMVSSRLQVGPNSIIVTAMKPVDGGRALMVRLWNAGCKPADAVLTWSDPKPRSVALSDLDGNARKAITGPIRLPPMGIVTLRAEMKEME